MTQFRTRSLVRRARPSLGARALFPVAVLALAALTACGSDPSSPTIAGKISRVSGDSQSVAAGTVMPNPMVVEVLAQNGKPLAGQTVTWSLATGASGTLPSSTSITDATGRASLGFTAGSVAGKAEITAIVGSAQGTIFTQQVVVKVTDTYGNAVSGVTVSWAAGSNGGTLSEASSTSDNAGLARVTLTLGATPGVYTVRATSGTLPASTFSVTAI